MDKAYKEMLTIVCFVFALLTLFAVASLISQGMRQDCIQSATSIELARMCGSE